MSCGCDVVKLGCGAGCNKAAPRTTSFLGLLFLGVGAFQGACRVPLHEKQRSAIGESDTEYERDTIGIGGVFDRSVV